MAPNEPGWRRWSEIFNRAERDPDYRRIVKEFQRQLNEYDHANPVPNGDPLNVQEARYNLCSDIMLDILEPKVSLRTEADEYEETMKAQEILESL